MRQNVNLGHPRLPSEYVEQLLKGVAGEVCALPVICVGAQPQFTTGRPREQYWNRRRLGVMDDLCKSVDRIIEAVVKTMHKDQHFALSGSLCRVVHGRNERWLIYVIRRNSHEVPTRIAREGCGPLNRPDFPR